MQIPLSVPISLIKWVLITDTVSVPITNITMNTRKPCGIGTDTALYGTDTGICYGYDTVSVIGADNDTSVDNQYCIRRCIGTTNPSMLQYMSRGTSTAVLTLAEVTLSPAGSLNSAAWRLDLNHSSSKSKPHEKLPQ